MTKTTLPSINTTVCIVGGGPAGMMLAYLLARQGIDVTLLEAQRDFDRKFRGDTLHLSILENIGQLGLMPKLDALPHTKITQMVNVVNGERQVMGDLSRLKNRPYPYMMMVAQPLVLQLLADEAATYPNFRLIMGASVQGLIEDGEIVRGVRYRQGRESGEVNASLTVGCDGRSSKVRREGGFDLLPLADPMEVLWITIAKSEAERAQGLGSSFGSEGMFITHERVEAWHIGLPLPQGGYAQLKALGIDHLRRLLCDAKPYMRDRIEAQVQSWRDVAVLKVQSGRVKRWFKSGLLLIGDAAHVMSPILGVGINYAVQDAVAASNILAPTLLKTGAADLPQLHKVQQRRQLPVSIIQRMQARIQGGLQVPTLADGESAELIGSARSPLAKIPFLRAFASQMGLKMVAIGFRPEKVQLTRSEW